jgi:hypothetical protein
MKEFDELLDALGQQPQAKDTVVAFFDFWFHPSRLYLQVDKGLSTLYFARATDALLQGGPDAEIYSRYMAVYSIILKGIAGGMTSKKIQDTVAAIQSIQSSDGVMRFLAGMIPCPCMDGKKGGASLVSRRTLE